MRLTTQDKIEFLKAAVKADDLEALKQWLVAVVDAADAAPADGKDTPVPVPPFRPRTAAPAVQAATLPARGDGTLAAALDGLRLEVVTPRGDVAFGSVADPATVAGILNAAFAGEGP